MIFKFWKDAMGFALAPLYIGGSFVKSVASIALPAIGFAVAGPWGAAAGGALAGMSTGGGIKGAILGGITGYAGGKLASGGFGGFGGTTGSAVQYGGKAAGLMGMSGTGAGTTAMLAGNIGPGQLLNMRNANFSGSTKPTSYMAKTAASKSGYAANTGVLSGPPQTIGKDVVNAGNTITQGRTTSNIVAKKGGLTGLSFDKEKIQALMEGGFNAYEGNIRQNQMDALNENIAGYKSEYSDYYAAEAKKQQDALARGELPDTYDAALDREADRMTRLLVAQGHNPAESGFGKQQLARSLMDLEQGFISSERDYWRAVGGGADTMQARMAELEAEQARQPNARTQGLSDFGRAAGDILLDLV
jgi:hypothetical protein